MTDLIEIDGTGVLGTWVRAARVHPQCNIWRRRWKLPDGREGTYLGDGSIPADRDGLMWFFPAEKRQEPAPAAKPRRRWWISAAWYAAWAWLAWEATWWVIERVGP